MPFSDAEIDHAWNTIIKDIPVERIELIERLKKEYKVYLLSNSNAIHYDYYNLYVKNNFDYESLDAIFEKAWYSFRMGLFKPDPRIYEQVLQEGGLVGEETLFIDDKLENVEAAERVGLKGYYLKEGEDVVGIFKDGKLTSSGF
jgi:putative hydrolase of the HAD superfamily